MTCREFMDAAGALTPSQLLRMGLAEHQPLAAHVSECSACREWLESQSALGNALHILSASTAHLEASSRVEQVLLQAFRKQELAPRVVELPQKAAKSLWTVSRFFEGGAYAAAAAALVVGMFLGARILRDQQNKPDHAQVQAGSAPQSDKRLPSAQSGGTKTSLAAQETAGKIEASASTSANSLAIKTTTARVRSGEADSAENSGYMALMLCDPLICSGDEQVIRMELPANAATGADGGTAQTVLADVVIGDDGVVRRMRIVN